MAAKITVVTPSYNQARFLEETLRSVLSQRDQIHEYFVLDGGSTDGSADLIRRYAEHGPGIDYWHSRKDTGQSDAIHQGFARATGDWLIWLNSDDVFLPGALHTVREAIDRNPHWDVLDADYVRFDADSRILSHHRFPAESTLKARWGVIHVAQQTCFFRKSLYERVGGLDLSLHCVMDTELWARMFDVNATWGHVSEYVSAFRIHEMAKGSSWMKEYAAEHKIMNARYLRYFDVGYRRLLSANLYRLGQVVSGRQLRASLDTRRNRGKKLADVFGDWKLPTGTPSATTAHVS